MMDSIMMVVVAMLGVVVVWLVIMRGFASEDVDKLREDATLAYSKQTTLAVDAVASKVTDDVLWNEVKRLEKDLKTLSNLGDKVKDLERKINTILCWDLGHTIETNLFRAMNGKRTVAPITSVSQKVDKLLEHLKLEVTTTEAKESEVVLKPIKTTRSKK